MVLLFPLRRRRSAACVPPSIVPFIIIIGICLWSEIKMYVCYLMIGKHSWLLNHVSLINRFCCRSLAASDAKSNLLWLCVFHHGSMKGVWFWAIYWIIFFHFSYILSCRKIGCRLAPMSPGRHTAIVANKISVSQFQFNVKPDLGVFLAWPSQYLSYFHLEVSQGIYFQIA